MKDPNHKFTDQATYTIEPFAALNATAMPPGAGRHPKLGVDAK
jgi:hypothetical protein